jgi:hypothetical protein
VSTVKALYALQNGFMGFERSGLFYGTAPPIGSRFRSRAISSAPPT